MNLQEKIDFISEYIRLGEDAFALGLIRRWRLGSVAVQCAFDLARLPAPASSPVGPKSVYDLSYEACLEAYESRFLDSD
jgi:hypothetical protein